MATDALILGPVEFTDWSAPEHMPLGGRQALAVHKLIGGRRVIDTLGSDEADITWNGQFWGDNAFSTALILDQLRTAGGQLPLFVMGKAYQVVIADFRYEAIRFPQHFTYSITCVVASDPSLGFLGAIASIGNLIATDISAAASLF